MDFKTNQEIAEEVNKRHSYEFELNRIRNDDSRTLDWKRAAIASLWMRVNEAQQKAVQERDEAKKKRRQYLEYRVFSGGQDVASSSQAATLVISRRDAADRTDALETEQQANELLRRADQLQDEPLASAVAHKAFEQRWAGVLNAYIETRPQFDDALNELWNEHAPTLQEQMFDGWALAASPAELSGMSDYQVRKLAEEQASA